MNKKVLIIFLLIATYMGGCIEGWYDFTIELVESPTEVIRGETMTFTFKIIPQYSTYGRVKFEFCANEHYVLISKKNAYDSVKFLTKDREELYTIELLPTCNAGKTFCVEVIGYMKRVPEDKGSFREQESTIKFCVLVIEENGDIESNCSLLYMLI